MTVKELAYSTQQHLQASTGANFKRAHIYELLAASFGFNSYAALGADSVFAERRSTNVHSSINETVIRDRCVTLGYHPDLAKTIPLALSAFVVERQIVVARISDLVAELRDENDELDDQDDIFNEDRLANSLDLNSSILLDGLESAARKGNALAHYALALFNAPDEEGEEHGVGSEYWYTQAQQGRSLIGVEKEWADAHATRLETAAKYVHHLQSAARLGQQDALLDLANRFDAPAFFEQAEPHVNSNPALVAEIAERLGRREDAKQWLTAAAESGDIEAMRQLIEDYDHDDLQRCWTWVYYAELVGADLTKDEHYAIHEDGSSYDDDVGGTVFVAGRGGVELDPLSMEHDAAARRAAQEFFKKSKSKETGLAL